MTIVTRRHIPRRAMLRGTAAAIALPLLDAMTPAMAAPAPPIRRFGAVYVGNGMSMNAWTQPAPGDLRLGTILQPLEPLRDRVVVLAGLDNKQAVCTDAGQHPRAQSAWLTGCRAKKTNGPDIHLGVSLDQILAREYGKETQLGSLELSLDASDTAGNCAYGFSCAYQNTIAWRTPSTPLPMENNPRNVFERLFGASDTTDSTVRLRQMKTDASILDSVSAQIRGFTGGLGPVDRRKLDEYLDALRDVERRIGRAEAQQTRELPVVVQPVGVPAAFEEYARLMFDLQLLAFQTDLTRVFTFVLVREANPRSYPEIGVADSHHPLSHHQNNAEKLARLAKINLFHVKQFAYFAEKLAATRDGERSLLDTTILLYGSGMSDPNLHAPVNVPTLLVSGREHGVRGNRYLRCAEGTPLANLQLTVLEKLGAPIETFGDSTGRLNLLPDV